MNLLSRCGLMVVGALLLAGCSFGRESITYTPAQVAPSAPIPAGAENRQISIETRIVTMDPQLVRDLNLGEDFGQNAGSLLTDSQFQKLIKAVQSERKAKVLAAPRLIVLNGQSGNMVVGNEIPYISDYRPSPTGPEPILSRVTAGVQADMQAISGAMPNVVMLALQVRISEIKMLREVPAVNIPADAKLSVQNPEMNLVELRTTAAVPAGSTLALMKGGTLEGRKTTLIVLARPKVME